MLSTFSLFLLRVVRCWSPSIFRTKWLDCSLISPGSLLTYRATKPTKYIPLTLDGKIILWSHANLLLFVERLAHISVLLAMSACITERRGWRLVEKFNVNLSLSTNPPFTLQRSDLIFWLTCSEHCALKQLWAALKHSASCQLRKDSLNSF